jgi:uncharacterized membrane protein YdbT with pleckstrin-like domain
MGYIEKILEPNERIIHRAYVHWIVYAKPLVLFALAIGVLALSDGTPGWLVAGYVLVVISGLMALSAWIERMTTEIAVTNQRVILKWGLIRRDTIEINASKVESVDVRQSVLGRLLNYGTITVRGTGGNLNPLKRVAAPLLLRRAVSRI